MLEKLAEPSLHAVVDIPQQAAYNISKETINQLLKSEVLMS